jgi:AhpD family alkylhydroperoxidase
MLDELSEPAWPPNVQAIMARVRAQGREPGRLYGTLANAPRTLDAWLAFATAIREDMALPRALRELVIIRVGQLTGSTYEVRQHRTMARAGGLSDAKLDSVHEWRDSPHFDDRERLCLEFCEKLVRGNQVPEQTWDLVVAAMTAEEAVELLVTASFYCMVSKVLAALRIT